MSQEMSEKKKEEAKQIEEEEKLLQQDFEDMKKDVCPYCGTRVSKYPYTVITPLGWMECASCGIIFCPRSIRNMKIRRTKQIVEVPGLVVPK